MIFSFDENTDVHEVTGTLKLFLREMPNPLLTYELYDAFIAAAGIEFEKEKPVIIKKCLELLPAFNRTIFHKICLLLNKISKNSQNNKMTPDNLSTCIVPNVLKPLSTDITIIINDAALQCSLMSSIIAECNYYFDSGSKEDLSPSKTELKSSTGLFLDLKSKDLEPLLNSENPENLYATLTIRYRQKQEKDRGRLQGLFDSVIPEEDNETAETIPEKAILTNDSQGSEREDEKVAFNRRLEFFEEMVKNGGLEIAPEHGAKVSALINNAHKSKSTPSKATPSKDKRKKKESSLNSPAERSRRITNSNKAKDQIKSDDKFHNELHKVTMNLKMKKPEKKKKND